MNHQPLTFDLPEAQGPGSRDGLAAADILRGLLRHKLLIAAIFAVVTGGAIALAVLWPPIYKASASLIVNADGNNDDLAGPMSQSAALADIMVRGQLEQMRSRALARRVAVNLGLADDLEFNPLAKPIPKRGRTPRSAAAGSPSEDVIDRLQAHVAVARVEGSNIITVAASARDPQLAARIANRFVIGHIELQREYALAANQRSIAVLTPQVEALRQRVIAADAQVATYRRRNGIVGLSDGSDLATLGRLAESLSDARSGLSESAARARVAAAGNVVEAIAAPGSAQLADLRRQAIELSKRVTELSGFYGEGYPDLINARAQLDDVNRRIAEENRAVSNGLQAEVRIRAARAGQIGSEVAAVTARSFDQRRANVQLMDLERNAEAERALYVASLSRLRQLAGKANLIAPSARIMARAVPPRDPSFPRAPQIIGVAAIGSLLLGLLLAYLIEFFDTRVRSAAQVARLTGLPTLGMIPKLAAADVPNNYRAPKQDPQSVWSESLRNLCFEVNRRLPPGRAGTVLVTSPLPGDGKSTIALGLGAAAAVLWQRAVVIDLDLRQPSLLEMAPAAGRAPADLIAYLEGRATIDDIIANDPVIGDLSVIGVAGIPANPAQLLASPRVAELLAELRSRFDLIVLSAPPILAVCDARQLAAQADATLLVLRWGETRADTVRNAIAVIDTPLAGVVINRVDFARHARLRYGDTIQHYAACASYYGGTVRA